MLCLLNCRTLSLIDMIVTWKLGTHTASFVHQFVITAPISNVSICNMSAPISNNKGCPNLKQQMPQFVIKAGLMSGKPAMICDNSESGLTIDFFHL